MGNKSRVVIAISQADTQASSSAKPAVVFFPNECPAANVTSSAINNVASFHPVARKPLCVSFGNAGYAILNNAVVPDVQRHDGRDSICYIVTGMKLAAEWPCLNVAASFRAKFAK